MQTSSTWWLGSIADYTANVDDHWTRYACCSSHRVTRDATHQGPCRTYRRNETFTASDWGSWSRSILFIEEVIRTKTNSMPKGGGKKGGHFYCGERRARRHSLDGWTQLKRWAARWGELSREGDFTAEFYDNAMRGDMTDPPEGKNLRKWWWRGEGERSPPMRDMERRVRWNRELKRRKRQRRRSRKRRLVQFDRRRRGS